MLKNDALDEIVDLTQRWECLTADLFADEFDYADFRLLAAHTFAFLFPFHAAETLPRDTMGVLFRINEFGTCPVNVSRESNAAQAVAQSFCLQIEEHWVSIDGAYSENNFVVIDAHDEYHIIDANTFDLAEML